LKEIPEKLRRLIELPEPGESLLQRAQWTRDILALMSGVILIAVLVIGIGILAGAFDLVSTFPIFVILALVLPSWWAAQHGGWRWASYVPPGTCFLLAAFGSYQFGFGTDFVLFYALAVLLAGMLQGSQARWLTVALATLIHGLLGQWHGGNGDPWFFLPGTIMVLFGLVGVALLQWYLNARMNGILAALVAGNRSLEQEMARRQQAEATAEDQEAQLRRLADNTTDLVAEIDPIGIFRYVSQSYWRALGYRPTDLLETNAFDLLHPEDQPAGRAAAQQAVEAHAPVAVQLRSRHKDGHYLYFEVSGTPLFDSTGQHLGFVLSSRDITLQKQAEVAIQESEKKFRAIIESTPLGIHMYHLEEDGSLIFNGYNPAAESILGIDLAPLLGMPLEIAFPGLAGTEISVHYRTIALSGGRWDGEQFAYRDDQISGVYEIHAFQTTPGSMVTSFSDITERIRAANALLLSEEKFATAFRTSPDAININRLSDGLYIDINQGFTDLTGYERAETIGKTSLELNIWDDPDDRARLVAGLQQRGQVENLEASFRRKNGNVAVALMSARVIEIGGEKCILSITRDISERQRAEFELRQAHAELEQAYEATLQGWVQALEMRERETGEHSRRVVEMTLKIARAMNFGPEELVHIQRGALLHDIGKMGVPDAILLKPGSFTPDEWVIMRRHPDFAYSLLNEIAYLRPAMDIPYCHHERWDGQGYPRGLKEQEIPLPARIFAVVDVYDALCSNRPYRPAWPVSEVRRYLAEQSDKQFDPAVVDLFLKM
jgi:PAS domain S-box-containing protein